MKASNAQKEDLRLALGELQDRPVPASEFLAKLQLQTFHLPDLRRSSRQRLATLPRRSSDPSDSRQRPQEFELKRLNHISQSSLQTLQKRMSNASSKSTRKSRRRHRKEEYFFHEQALAEHSKHSGKTPLCYEEMGDMSMYTKQALDARAALRYSDNVVKALNRFWMAMDPIQRESGVGREGYVALHIRMNKALRSGFRSEKARILALEEWMHDRKRSHRPDSKLEREDFFDTLFQTVDNWTQSIEELDYVEFLEQLFVRIAKKKVPRRDPPWPGIEEPRISSAGIKEEEAEDSRQSRTNGIGPGAPKPSVESVNDSKLYKLPPPKRPYRPRQLAAEHLKLAQAAEARKKEILHRQHQLAPPTSAIIKLSSISQAGHDDAAMKRRIARLKAVRESSGHTGSGGENDARDPLSGWEDDSDLLEAASRGECTWKSILDIEPMYHSNTTSGSAGAKNVPERSRREGLSKKHRTSGYAVKQKPEKWVELYHAGRHRAKEAIRRALSNPQSKSFRKYQMDSEHLSEGGDGDRDEGVPDEYDIVHNIPTLAAPSPAPTFALSGGRLDENGRWQRLSLREAAVSIRELDNDQHGRQNSCSDAVLRNAATAGVVNVGAVLDENERSDHDAEEGVPRLPHMTAPLPKRGLQKLVMTKSKSDLAKDSAVSGVDISEHKPINNHIDLNIDNSKGQKPTRGWLPAYVKGRQNRKKNAESRLPDNNVVEPRRNPWYSKLDGCKEGDALSALIRRKKSKVHETLPTLKHYPVYQHEEMSSH